MYPLGSIIKERITFLFNMKHEINQLIRDRRKIGEIVLFRKMEESLNKYIPSLLIQETHGRNGWVKFDSKLARKKVQKEISDLMILCFNKNRREIKLSFLQAKYHPHRINPFLKFQGDYLQLELLRERPNISSKSKYNFPPDILNFSDYRSLTTYGVFYHDQNKEIDFHYTIADYLTSLGTALKGTIQFPGCDFCPKPHCHRTNKKEMLTTCNIDIFEIGLITHKIGAPIPKGSRVESYIYSLLKTIESNTQINIELFLEYFNSPNIELLKKSNSRPNILLVQSDDEIKMINNEITLPNIV